MSNRAKLERRRASRALKFSPKGAAAKKGRESQAMSEPPSPRLTGSPVSLLGVTTLFGLSQMQSVVQARLRKANSLALTASWPRYNGFCLSVSPIFSVALVFIIVDGQQTSTQIITHPISNSIDSDSQAPSKRSTCAVNHTVDRSVVDCLAVLCFHCVSLSDGRIPLAERERGTTCRRRITDSVDGYRVSKAQSRPVFKFRPKAD